MNEGGPTDQPASSGLVGFDRAVRRRLVSNTVGNTAARLLAIGTSFALTPFILGSLGPATYGLWVLVGSLVAYGSLFDLGIGGTVVRSVAADRARGDAAAVREVIATSLVLYAGLGIVVVALSAVLAMAVPGLFRLDGVDAATASTLVLVMGVTLGVTLPSTTAWSVLRGIQRYDVVSGIRIVGTLASAALTVVVLAAGLGVVALVAIALPVTLLTQLLAGLAIRRLAPEYGVRLEAVRRSRVRAIASFGWPLFVQDVAGRLQGKTDEIVIAAMLPIAAVTPYALARKLSVIPQQLAEQFTAVLLPMAAALDGRAERDGARTLLVVGTRITLALFVPVALTIALLAGPIVTAWVGPGFPDAPLLVVLLSVALLLDMATWPAGSVLQGVDRHRPLAGIALATGIANVALSLALVGPMGLVGVALATLLPNVVETLLVVIPYAMWATGLGGRRLLVEGIAPVALAAVPQGVLLAVAAAIGLASSFVSIALVGLVGVGVFALIYLRLPGVAVERAIVADVLGGVRRRTVSRTA